MTSVGSTPQPVAKMIVDNVSTNTIDAATRYTTYAASNDKAQI